MKILESAENYLESIVMLSENGSKVRSVDVARKLGFSKPTVSVMIRQLRENGYVLVDEDGFLSLTEEGSAIAFRIYERHKILSSFLMSIGVNEETAFADACKIEHDISDESFSCLKQFLRPANR